MTKAELIDAINKKATDAGVKLTKKDTHQLVDIVFETVAGSIEKEKRFSYPNFGTFKVKHRPARKGRNPQTGKPIKIAASNSVSFKSAPALTDQIN